MLRRSHHKTKTPTEKPPVPSAVDYKLASQGRSTVALDALPENMQAAKLQLTPDLKQIIEIKAIENSNLRRELAFFKIKEEPLGILVSALYAVHRELEETLEQYAKEIGVIDDDERTEFGQEF